MLNYQRVVEPRRLWDGHLPSLFVLESTAAPSTVAHFDQQRARARPNMKRKTNAI